MSATKTQYENSYMDQLNQAIQQQALQQQERSHTRRTEGQAAERRRSTFSSLKALLTTLLVGGTILAATAPLDPPATVLGVLLSVSALIGLGAWLRRR